MFAALARFVLEHRAVTAVLLLVVSLGVISGASRLQTDFSAAAFFGTGDSELDLLLAHKERWGADDATMLVLVQADDGSSVLRPDRLEAIGGLTDQLREAPEVVNVLSLTHSPRLVGELQGMIDLSETVLDTLPEEPEAFDSWSRELLEHPLLVPALLASDGSATALIVELDVDADDIAALRPTVLQVRSLLESLDGSTDLSVLTAGIPAVRTDFFQAILEDQKVTVPLIGAVIVLLLFGIFRRPHGVIGPGLAAGLPALMVFGAMGWFGEDLGILNQSYFTLLPAIAIADAIHMVSRFHEEARRLAPPGQPLAPDLRKQAIVRAVSRIGAACLLTTATTGAGFLSLQVAQMPILRGFGLYAALGIAIAYGGVLILVPLILSTVRGTVPGSNPSAMSQRVDRALLACANFAIHRSALVGVLTALVVAASIFFGTKVVVDNTLTGLLRADHPTTVANGVIDEKLGGILGLEISLQGPTDSLKDPEVIAALDALDRWALQREEIQSVQGPAQLLRTLQQVIDGRREVPDSRPGIAQLYLLAEGDRSLEAYVDVWDYASGRAVLQGRDVGGLATEKLCEATKEQLAVLFDGLPVQARLTGTPYIAYRGINDVTRDLRNSLIVAFGIVTLMILLLFRSLRIALLCLLPNALPLIVGYGAMGAMGWILDPTPAVVFTVALGIAVDDTIHLVARWREELEAGRGGDEALRRAVLHTGRAVAITTVVLVAGFGVNYFSSFPTLVILGLLGGTVISTALISDIFVLPALLTHFGGAPRQAPTAKA